MNESPEFINVNDIKIPLSLKTVCDLKHSVLLVYDAQEGIINQIKNKEKIVAGIKQVLIAARKAGMKIYFSRHLSLPKNLMGLSQIRTAMQWQKTDSFEKVSPWFLRDTPAFNITSELEPLPSEAIFDKLTMSAFEGTYLDIALRDSYIHTLIIIGAAIEIGIEPTARHASDLGYIPVIVSDACGFGDEAAAERSLAGLSFAGYGYQTDIKTICSIFSSLT